MSADGVARLLGKPDLDPLDLVVRETVQNSWDARLEGKRPKYSVSFRELGPDARHGLSERVFKDLPPCHETASLLNGHLGGEHLYALQIADFNTKGLGGPVNPEEVPGDRPTDYVDFVRNLGSPRDVHHGGGTYGYGKSSLYRFSQCRTVIIDSWSAYDQERRFVAVHLGDRFDVLEGRESGRYTGRHWWGVDGGHPVTGERADELGEVLGLPKRDSENPGTTVLILAPDLLLEDSDGVALSPRTRLNETLLWHFWPKMIADESGRFPMEFSVTDRGFQHSLLGPDQVPPFHLYAQAMRKLKRGDGTVIRCQRPARSLGRLAFMTGARAPRMSGFSAALDEPAHGVALMRPAELVVTYLRGKDLGEEEEWAGVFICDEADEVERAFAQSEPPAHDAWVPNNLPLRSTEKRFVNVGLREIKRAIAGLGGAPEQSEEERDVGGGLGLLARALGRSLSTVEGAEGGRRVGSARPGRKPSRRKPSVVLTSLSRSDGVTSSTWEVQVPRSGAGGAQLVCDAQFLLQGGASARNLPEQGGVTVSGWTAVDGTPLSNGPQVEVPEGIERLFVSLVAPADFAVRIKVDFASGAGA